MHEAGRDEFSKKKKQNIMIFLVTYSTASKQEQEREASGPEKWHYMELVLYASLAVDCSS